MVTEVCLRKPYRHLPRAPPSASASIACVQTEEVFQRPHAPHDSDLAIPGNVLPGQKVRKGNVATVKREIAAKSVVTLHPDLHPFASQLQCPDINDRFKGTQLIGLGTVNLPRVEPVRFGYCFGLCTKLRLVVGFFSVRKRQRSSQCEMRISSTIRQFVVPCCIRDSPGELCLRLVPHNVIGILNRHHVEHARLPVPCKIGRAAVGCQAKSPILMIHRIDNQRPYQKCHEVAAVKMIQTVRTLLVTSADSIQDRKIVPCQPGIANSASVLAAEFQFQPIRHVVRRNCSSHSDTCPPHQQAILRIVRKPPRFNRVDSWGRLWILPRINVNSPVEDSTRVIRKRFNEFGIFAVGFAQRRFQIVQARSHGLIILRTVRV